ncbi:MAG: radical SAM family heme chaperone HemW [Gemmatimonadota bacterium]|nr:radical SAM family heme chaperone HemW [Gemmatimonadota bacterium]
MRRNVPVSEYLVALSREWRLRALTASVSNLNTLYLGGGTPSLLGGDGIAELMEWVQSVATLSPGAEITLEANPEDITPQSVAEWKRAGINRLSIGVQSFDDVVLRWMHRVHTADTAGRAAHIARDGGIQAFSIDLIFALPQSLNRNWELDLERALTLGADHISLYGLTFEPRTPLGRWQARGEVIEAGEEQYEQQFLLAHELLSANGYEHYDVSNFARPGKRALHNSSYWSGVPYIGVGPAAHGFDGGTRRANVSSYSAWVEQIAAGTDPAADREVLSRESLLMESVYLGLRTIDGLEVKPADQPLVSKWMQAGWLAKLDSTGMSRVRCTPTGWLRLDSLAADLTALRSR